MNTRWSDSRPFELADACSTFADVVTTVRSFDLGQPLAGALLAEVRLAEVRLAEVRLAEVRLAEVRLAEVRLSAAVAPVADLGGIRKINNYMGATSAMGEGVTASIMEHSAARVQTVHVDKVRSGSAFGATARGIPPRGRPV